MAGAQRAFQRGCNCLLLREFLESTGESLKVAAAGAKASVVEKQKTARTTGKRNSVGGTTEGLEVGRKTLSTLSVVRGLVRWLVAFDKNVPVEKGASRAEGRSSQLAEYQSRD